MMSPIDRASNQETLSCDILQVFFFVIYFGGLVGIQMLVFCRSIH